jgi:hypothetical protein
MALRICKQCKHYKEINQCGHPELVDNVTGDPADCYMTRTYVENPQIPHCGPTGAYWEAKPEPSNGSP